MTAPTFHAEADPSSFVAPPESGTLSRTLHSDDDVRVVVFGFAEGEELTEHTSSRPAVIQDPRPFAPFPGSGSDREQVAHPN